MPGLTIPLVLWANGMATRNNIHSRGLFRLNSGPVLQRLECGSRNTEPNQPRRATGLSPSYHNEQRQLRQCQCNGRSNRIRCAHRRGPYHVRPQGACGIRHA